MDALHVGNLIAAVGAATVCFAYLIVVAQAGDQLTLEFATWVEINGVIDGLVGHGFLRVVGPQGAQFAGNLLW